MRSDTMKNENIKIGFIGCGNMGGAIARAISRISQTSLHISEPNAEKAVTISKELCAEISNNEAICETADFIFLAIKPGLFDAVLPPLKEHLEKNKGAVVVTMAAGVQIKKLESLIGDHPIIRIMPNTPAAIGLGMITWCKNALVTEESSKTFLHLMSNAGTLDEIGENMIDAASAVAGCGPAFVYMFIEALADGGVECGLSRDRAMLYAAKTLMGAAEMVIQTGKHPGLLKDEVCSPGGSTIEGVHALEESAFRAASANAVVAAFEKTKKLGK